MRKDETMKKTKREVTYDGNTYKVRSDTIEIPDFSQMERTAVLLWMCRHTYPRGYSKPNPLQGCSGAIQLSVKG
jgi:hypothetical protein